MYKNKISIVLLFLVSLTLIVSCSPKLTPQTAEKHYFYTCPMHRDVIVFNPGTCPKCGMGLEKMDMEDMPKTKSVDSHGGHSNSGGSCH